ncbi:MAG: hypothetical protein JRI72_06025 [Deltaproteobacteria bacterium]|nr:hypothetical protein [Deltaproteobacteria bacterium]
MEENERVILETGKEISERYGYQVITAGKGKKIIPKYSHGSIALLKTKSTTIDAQRAAIYFLT